MQENLSKTATLYKEKHLTEAKNKSITNGNDTNCDHCKKNFGATVFSVYPNMKIYHNKCSWMHNNCPTTRTDFSKKQIF